MATIWDSATATAVTISGGGLVATNTGTTSQDQGAHVAAALGQTTGKYYFEITWTSYIGGVDLGAGVGTPTSTYTGMGFTGGVVGVMYYIGGSVYANGSLVLNGSAWTAGQIMGVAVDLDNRKIWFRQSPAGAWVGTGTPNPVTNTGGFTIPAGTMVPFVTFGGAGGVANNVVTANFGASGFSGAVPSGFIAGFPTATNTTWNPSDKSAAITLSGGNLIATSTASGGNTVRAIDKQVTGKFYWEYTGNILTNIADGFGIASSAYPLNTVVATAGTSGSVALARSGTVFSDGATVGIGFGTIAAGTVVCIAFDADARLAWFRLGAAGNWNNSASANPATGVGGVSVTSVGKGIPAYPTVSFNANGDQVTANFGDSAFTGTVPAGFTSGFTAGATAPNNVLATQAALEEWITTNPQAQVTQVGLEEWVVLAGGTAPPPATAKQYAVSIVS